MKIVQFIGASDKTDFLLYICKLIASNGHKVLLVDATLLQDYEFAFPRVEGDLQVHEYDDFDVIHGCGSAADVQNYFMQKEADFNYEYMIIDSNNSLHVDGWEADRLILYNTMENIHNIRNLGILDQYFSKYVKDELVLVSKIMNGVVCSINEEYIDSLYDGYPIQWDEPTHYLIPDERDYAIKIDNQYRSVIQLKGLTRTYRKALIGVLKMILELPDKEVHRIWKKAGKVRKYGTSRILG
ncbi:hypothetical protein [Paenibacillus sp. UMB4589-SE434]|uniref:hypothetical protein n=1 Tax=Paenibacillus sp. UMB4589-SE434 TaxID=3046314 RepID=UPI00254EEAB2|nr:hypothetical protein [Paenibacillus sp. UMB4589-SE434]MDK8181833.1 hypothetical protein [Paenibacillus sp. UMB4589-SE434]